MTLKERGGRAWRACRALLALPADERRLYRECWIELVLARMGSRRFRLSASAPLRETDGGSLTLRQERTVLDAFQAAVATSPVATPCLTRALALARVLRRHGASARVALGMRHGVRGIEGHAWVESRGRVVGEPAAEVGDFLRFETAA